ncbi:unnamed protein product, partial [Durusdinium trenchii]
KFRPGLALGVVELFAESEIQAYMLDRPPGFFATHHRRPARVLVPSFRELGDHGVGVGNALFTLAAAMSLVPWAVG